MSDDPPQGCGLCGAKRAFSKAHVPARTAGNAGETTRQFLHIIDGSLGATDPRIGGMHTRGLCRPCNSLAGSNYDAGYGRFHTAVDRAVGVWAAGLARRPSYSGITVVPALVARSVLCGMFALNTQLRLTMPEAATDLRANATRVRWSSEWGLLLALNSGVRRAEGGIARLRLLHPRMHRMAAAEVWFPPLSWALVPFNPSPPELGKSYFDVTAWVDVSHWINLRHEAPLIVAASLANAPRLDSFLLPGDRPEAWTMVYSPESASVVLGGPGQEP